MTQPQINQTETNAEQLEEAPVSEEQQRQREEEEQRKLDEAIEMTFPASDPLSI